MALSRPAPGPLTRTSTERTPCSLAASAQTPAATWAAKGVPLRVPRKFWLPEEAQESGTHNVERESLHQRKQVLESCLANLELKKAARTGRARLRTVGDLLDGLTVADFMSSEVRSVHRAASIKEAGRLLQKWKVGSLLVDDGSRYIGILTDTDLSRKAVAKGLDPNTTTVTLCMSKSVVTIEDSEPLMEAITIMKEEGIRHLPVTEDGTIVGLLSVADLLRAYEEVLD